MIYAQTAVLVAILVVLVMILRKPISSVQLPARNLEEPPPEVQEPIPPESPIKTSPRPIEPRPAPDPDPVWEVVHLLDGEWRHHSWVRHGTKAYHHAYDTPGVALRRGETLEEGVQ
jgi:hypothetical protein